jgi:hypothetical protein
MTMADEGFLRRWARRKSELRTEVREGGVAPAGQAPLQPADPAAVATALAAQPASHSIPPPQPDKAPERPLPTMDDVATLDSGSDFSAFVARGVDQAVRRSALKKLFADPHFNTMDRLDVYIDDYTQPSPVSEQMLASLEHAKSAFLKMIEDPEEQAPKTQEPQTQQPPEQETQ